MASDEFIKRRIIAVLDYDEIPASKRAPYLKSICGFSLSTAYRVLKGADVGRMRWRGVNLAQALNVDWAWLWNGSFTRGDIRTMRIHVQEYKGYPKADTDKIMRMYWGSLAGYRKARNLLELAATNKMSFSEAARLL